MAIARGSISAATSGIKVGDKFNIISVGEALIDPDTEPKTLGADERQIGNWSAVVTEVQPGHSRSCRSPARRTRRTPSASLVPVLRLRTVSFAFAKHDREFRLVYRDRAEFAIMSFSGKANAKDTVRKP